MSDETPTPADEQPAAESAEPAEASVSAEGAASSEGAVATIDTAATPAVGDHARPPAEPVTFTRKFLLPLLIPLAVTAAIVFFVLNVSRVFLASDSTLAVIYASIITLAILGAGSALAAAPKLRSSSLTLMFGGGLLVVLMGGLISIGAASPEGGHGPVQCEPVSSELTVEAGPALRFAFPEGDTVKAGCVDIALAIKGGSHTLLFETPPASENFPELGIAEKEWAGEIAEPGEYKFICTIPGHAAAGMVATLKVTE